MGQRNRYQRNLYQGLWAGDHSVKAGGYPPPHTFMTLNVLAKVPDTWMAQLQRIMMGRGSQRQQQGVCVVMKTLRECSVSHGSTREGLS